MTSFCCVTLNRIEVQSLIWVRTIIKMKVNIFKKQVFYSKFKCKIIKIDMFYIKSIKIFILVVLRYYLYLLGYYFKSHYYFMSIIFFHIIVLFWDIILLILYPYYALGINRYFKVCFRNFYHFYQFIKKLKFLLYFII